MKLLYHNYENYIGKNVVIKHTNKQAYIKDNVVGKQGVVEKVSSDDVGVLIDGMRNKASGYGIYWFNINEVKFLNNKGEEDTMKDVIKGFKNVAVVNLVDDRYERDYGFALFDEDMEVLTHLEQSSGAMAVVNARGKDNRVLGIIKKVMPLEKYIEEYDNANITAEVVGIVVMDGYIAREEEKVRLAELAKKKAAIERELEAEINKRKSVEYYEEMARKYSDNPKLAELVAELKSLEK